jgi:hypothetical protein
MLSTQSAILKLMIYIGDHAGSDAVDFSDLYFVRSLQNTATASCTQETKSDAFRYELDIQRRYLLSDFE